MNPREYLRPWKLISFLLGMSWLVWGALYHQFSDWDIGISILMGGLTYISAPWSARVLFERQWSRMPLAFICWYISVDLIYVAYHTIMGNEMIRWENFVASTFLYWLCGFIWLHNGPLLEILSRPILRTSKTTEHT